MLTSKGLVYKKHKDVDELDVLIRRTGTVIYDVRNHLPLDPYPEKLTICPNRINLTVSNLFSKQEFPIPIENITGARLSRTMFFATLTIETFGYEKPPPIKYMKINEARMARRYILALVECKKNGINLNNYELSQLKEKLRRIGKVQEGH